MISSLHPASFTIESDIRHVYIRACKWVPDICTYQIHLLTKHDCSWKCISYVQTVIAIGLPAYDGFQEAYYTAYCAKSSITARNISPVMPLRAYVVASANYGVFQTAR